MSKNLNRPFFMDFLTTLSRVIEQQKSNPDSMANLDEGDGIMDMMLKPTLQTYESKEGNKAGGGGDSDEDD